MQIRYEQALIDTALKFEAIKPRFFYLQKTNEQLAKENLASQIQQRFMSFQHDELKRNFESSLADQRKKKTKWGAAGFVLGVALAKLIF